MAHATFRAATYADLEALPGHVKGEVIDGVLHTQPRPRGEHSLTETNVASEIH